MVWGQQQRRTKREPPAFRTTRAITQLRTFKFPFRFWKFATNTFPPSPTPPFTHAFRVGCNCRGVWERHRYMLLGQQHTALVYGDVLQLPAAGVAVQQKLITRHLCQQPATLFASRNTLSKNVTSIPPNPLLPLSSKTMLDSPHTHTHTHVTFLSAQKEMNCSVAIKTAIAVAFPYLRHTSAICLRLAELARWREGWENWLPNAFLSTRETERERVAAEGDWERATEWESVWVSE